MLPKNFKNIVIITLSLLPYIYSSNGDKSYYFKKCLLNCTSFNCTAPIGSYLFRVPEFNEQSKQEQSLCSWLLQWGCVDECKYDCMWTTVNWFAQHEQPIPKFYGKWPFYRLFGIQEPASAFFSVLNLLAHAHMFRRLNKKLKHADSPFKICWRLFSVVCMNAWFWSTVFHTRDTFFTEFMDYACALSMLMSFFASGIVRFMYNFWHPYPALVILSPVMLYFLDRMRYLSHGFVNYDDNMILNIGVGVAAGLAWLLFAICQWRQHGNEASYVWRLVAFTTLSAASMLLELGDFPPILAVLDAHALWHFTTAPLPFLYYQFLLDDINFIIDSHNKRRGQVKRE